MIASFIVIKLLFLLIPHKIRVVDLGCFDRLSAIGTIAMHLRFGGLGLELDTRCKGGLQFFFQVCELKILR